MSDARTLKGNETLVLDERHPTCVIEAGVVALFAVTPGDGSRSFLFRAGPGDALFGLPSGRGEDLATIVAVALQATSLRNASEDGELFDGWARKWRRRLEAGEADRDEAESDSESSQGAIAPDARDAFHVEILERVRRLLLQERERERTRFLERGERSREITRQALRELASVLDPGDESAPEGPDLFVAAAAAAGAQGIRLVPALAWERADGRVDPVEMIARASHVRVRQVLLESSWHERDCGPLLAFSGKERRPVALLPRSAGVYEIFDPATRTRRPVDPATANDLDSRAYMFYRPLPEKAAGGLELLRFALRGRWAELVLIVATGFAATLLGMFTPQATALLVDHAIPDADRNMLLQIGLGLAAAAFGGALFQLAQGIAMMRLETGADVAIQPAVWDRLLNLRLSFVRQFTTGDLQSRVGAVGQIRSCLSGTTLRSLFSGVILLLNFGLLLYYSPLLALVALVVALSSAAVTVGAGVMILRCVRTIMELRGHFFGLMVQLVNGVAKLRVAAAEHRAFARWAQDYARLLRLELRQDRIQDTVQGINVALSTFSAVVLFAAAAALIRQTDGGLTTGVFLAFHVAYGTFVGAVVSLSYTVTDVMEVSILRERARPILETEPEVSEAKTDPGRIEGRVGFDHVTFQYLEEGPVVLDDVSLRVEPGQFVAFVGPSGSGKSTILKLLLGLETPDSGSIFVDGRELSGLDVQAVRRQIGVVLQTGRINVGSIFDNIACSTRISLNDAWDAARATGLAADIEAMPMGMHTVISEGGGNLSGGQRQRVLLTRALAHGPSVLLLDEATSALDNETQAIVSDSLRRLGITRIVIAHRLSTIRDADWIYVVEAGRIVQQGTFDDLSCEEGLFARLMARQLA